MDPVKLAFAGAGTAPACAAAVGACCVARARSSSCTVQAWTPDRLAVNGVVILIELQREEAGGEDARVRLMGNEAYHKN